jgi:hypothetical protein
MTGLSLIGAAAYAAGLAATLVLAAWLTPRSWWRRANTRALAVLAAGTFGIGSIFLWLFAPTTAALAAPTLALAQPLPVADAPVAGAAYRTYDDLNLRASRSVNAPRLGVVAGGASVTATGARAGDWWEIDARLDGRTVRGWASSLWLRRAGELRH